MAAIWTSLSPAMAAGHAITTLWILDTLSWKKRNRPGTPAERRTVRTERKRNRVALLLAMLALLIALVSMFTGHSSDLVAVGIGAALGGVAGALASAALLLAFARRSRR